MFHNAMQKLAERSSTCLLKSFHHSALEKGILPNEMT